MDSDWKWGWFEDSDESKVYKKFARMQNSKELVSQSGIKCSPQMLDSTDNNFERSKSQLVRKQC